MTRQDDAPWRDLPDTRSTETLEQSPDEGEQWPAYEPGSSATVSDSDPLRPTAPVPRRNHVAHVAVAAGFASALVMAAGAVGIGGDDEPPETARVETSTGWVSADPSLLTGVVSVNSGSQGLATGVVVSSDGTVVAPYDALLGADSLTVTLPDGNQATQVEAELAGFDVTRDLAVLRVPGLRPAARATLASRLIGGGASVTVVNQNGVARPTQIRATVGTTRARAQISVGDAGSYLSVVDDLFTVPLDWSRQPGGGAVLDSDGAVAGIVILSYNANGQELPPSTLFVVPIDEARQVVADVDAGRDTRTVRTGDAGDLGLAYGVDYSTVQVSTYVTAVVPGGPAARAGIRRGDVLLSIDGTSVHNNLGATIGVEGVIRMLEPGTKVPVEWQPAGGGPARKASLEVGRDAT